MKRLLLSIFTIAAFGMKAQIVNIPDANFKADLVGNSAINTNMDSEIQVSEAQAFVGTMNLNNESISDLTGIEAFINLPELWCSQNSLSSVDLSANTALVDLRLSENNLSTIDVSQNTLLERLYVGANALTSIDVSSNLALEVFICVDNGLAQLDVSMLTNLTELACGGNSLTTLDISPNTAVTVLRCADNELSSLNVANGNNMNFTVFTAVDNWSSGLTCIQVDDAAWSTANWSQIDAAASFSENCSGSAGLDEFSAVEVDVYPNPATNQLNIESDAAIEALTIFTLSGKVSLTSKYPSIDLSGLESGVYLVSISTDKGDITKRFVKQ